jgi:hypothetical protein
MKSIIHSPFLDLKRPHRHDDKEHFAERAQYSKASLYNHGARNASKTTVHSQELDSEDAPVNSLWVIKIGNHDVGKARLVQDGRHSARIVLFRIDPEWSHTKVPVNLIHSIKKYCENHGGLKVSMQPQSAPPWMFTLLNQLCLESSKKKLAV